MSKTEKVIDYVIQQLNKVGENFGWQIGRIGANYENGYMKSNQDCKTHFRKEKIKKDIEAIINDHGGEVTEMVVNEDKKQMLGECIYHRCSYGECDECEFFNEWDDTDGDYFCAIRDKDGNIPYYQNWDMNSALGMDHIREVAKKVETNADRVMRMPLEELIAFVESPCKTIKAATYPNRNCVFNCDECIEEWLKEKVKDETQRNDRIFR